MPARMRKASATSVAVGFLAAAVACAPKLDAPRESIRVSGTVEDVAGNPVPAATPPAVPAGKDSAKRRFPISHTQPLGVAVYEACSAQLYFFRRCPGKFLGEAKLTKPGTFVVEIDTQAPEIVVFGFRGFLGPEQDQEACDEARVPIEEATKPIALKLKSGTCSIKLERRYG
ncbi:MAG: hypothetical protein ACREQ9_20095 [Candidatus Binatia bacterium]